MSDIFISYKKEDRLLAEQVIDDLKQEGFSVWYDERLDPSQSWDSIIEREIAAAKAVVVLWTVRSRESEWVRNEADYGKEHGKLVPARLDDCIVPLAFRRVQTADIGVGENRVSSREWAKFITWIRTLTHGEISDTNWQEPLDSAATYSAPVNSRQSSSRAAMPKILFGLALLTFGLSAAYYYGTYSQSPVMENEAVLPAQETQTKPNNARLTKALELYDKAFTIAPKHISARGHLESRSPRLCIASEHEPHLWENLFTALRVSKKIDIWTLGMDAEIFSGYMTENDCLLGLFSVEYLNEAAEVKRIMDKQGEDPPYEIFPLSESFERWEVDL